MHTFFTCSSLLISNIKLPTKMVVAFLLLIPFLALMFRYSAEEIEEKVNSFRMMLQEKQEPAVNTNEKPT